MSAQQEFAPDFASLSRLGGRSSLEEYGRFQQHLVLLEDGGRMAKYCAALGATQPGDVVVDVGAGTGILGLLALKRGFDHAFLIEPSRKMAAYARHLADLNGFSERVTILCSTLEDVDVHSLPTQIDLIVSETISSLLFGFGCWDALPSLVQRLGTAGITVPASGQLFVAPTQAQLATRGPTSDGLAMLRTAGLTIDLFERTFRSGGNVYDKRPIARLLADEALQPVEIASFNLLQHAPTVLHACMLEANSDAEATGVVLFWDIQLSPGIEITNLDPVVTSWYPLYVPLKRALRLPAPLELRLLAIDAPYKYAFKFVSNGEDVSHVLYW